MSAPTLRVIRRVEVAPTEGERKVRLEEIIRRTIPSLDDSSIEHLLALRYPNGEAILSSNDPGAFTNILNLLMKTPLNEAILFLESIEKPTDIIYQSPLFAAEKEKVEMELNNLQTKTVVAKGIFTCPRCRGQKTISAQKQIRSADEPMTTFVKCLSCGLQWKED